MVRVRAGSLPSQVVDFAPARMDKGYFVTLGGQRLHSRRGHFLDSRKVTSLVCPGFPYLNFWYENTSMCNPKLHISIPRV